MSGVENDPAAQTDSKKLDQLFGLVTTMNTRLDRQSQQVTTVESAIPLLAQACDVVLPTGSSGGSSGTATGTGAGDNRRPATTKTRATDRTVSPSNRHAMEAATWAQDAVVAGAGARGTMADWAAAVLAVTAVMTQGRVDQKLTFPPSMVRVFLCLGSTNVPYFHGMGTPC
jgi:hypothetical protein